VISLEELHGFKKLEEDECEGFQVRQKVVPKKEPALSRVGEI